MSVQYSSRRDRAISWALERLGRMIRDPYQGLAIAASEIAEKELEGEQFRDERKREPALFYRRNQIRLELMRDYLSGAFEVIKSQLNYVDASIHANMQEMHKMQRRTGHRPK